jgi:hypothetical protein
MAELKLYVWCLSGILLHVWNFKINIFLCFLYTKVATSNVHSTHEPNELARAIFARFLTSQAGIFARFFNEPSRAGSIV